MFGITVKLRKGACGTYFGTPGTVKVTEAFMVIKFGLHKTFQSIIKKRRYYHVSGAGTHAQITGYAFTGKMIMT
jgi:hypothetical protein